MSPKPPHAAPLPKIIVILGPTASGKTALAVALARRFSGEVISADSRQVYRGLDIGTEKITAEEMDSVPHHLIDIADPRDTLTAAQWAHAATEAIAEMTKRGKIPIIAGGTFFYIETLLFPGRIPPVPPNPPLRAELETHSVEELFSLLKQKDPARAATIDAKNPRRLVRALEIVDALGNVPVPTGNDSPYEVLMIGLETERSALRERIGARLRDTLKKGLIAETQRLLASGISKERLNEIGLEYRVVIEHLDGRRPETDVFTALEQKVWEYAKRQLTWLKRQKNIQWYRKDETEKVFELVEQFLRR